MVRAWYMDNDGCENPKEEHQRLPPEFITLEDLYKISGVEYHAINNVENYENDETIDKLKEGKSYTYQEEVTTPDNGDLQVLYTEHLHEDEQLRLVLEGCGYYDVRDKNEQWIRIEVLPGDLLVIPSGCYHRFMLDIGNYYREVRFYQKPYKAYARPAENLPFRQAYVKKILSGSFNT